MPAPYVVTDLVARTGCEGLTVHLSWTNPGGASYTKVIRSTRQWPYDLTDAHTVVYAGDDIESLTDGPPFSTPALTLQGNTYYYYVVLVSTGSTTDFDFGDDSRTYALSIDVLDSKTWFEKHTPRDMLARDAAEVEDGGGGGFLAQWHAVMGCWLDLLRGTANAVLSSGNDDKSPYHLLPAKNKSIGVETEGAAYDYSVPRRIQHYAVSIFKIKGTCPGIIAAVKMFTKWDAICVPLDGSECPGVSSLRTWDGTSEYFVAQNTDTTTEPGLTTDPNQSWDEDLWASGRIYDYLGGYGCVGGNTETEIELETPPTLTTLDVAHTAGNSVFMVDSTRFLYAGGIVEVSQDDASGAEIFHIASVDAAAGSFTVTGVSLNSYSTGSYVHISKDIIHAEYVGDITATVSIPGTPDTSTVTESDVLWEQNQWAGYYFLGEDNVKRLILSNTTTVLTVEDISTFTPGEQYAISTDFDLGAAFADREPHFKYRVSNGVHTTLYDPIADRTTGGTRYNQHNPLWNGPGLNTAGVWGPADLGIYITTPNILLTVGKVSGSSGGGTVLHCDASTTALSVNALAGMVLNPNQNQEQTFEVVSNTTNTITVAEAIGGLITVGQVYYVLTQRNATRLKRLADRLRREFVEADTNPHVLFV